MNYQRLLLVAAMAALLTLSEGAGQITLGTISGTVKDSTGAVLPGVTVKAQHLETGSGRGTMTDDAGRFHLPQLALGEYELQAELAGFQTAVRSGISLTVGRELEVSFVLSVGEITEKVEVTGEAPLVETTSAVVSGLVSEKTIRDLPLNGRTFDQLISLQAGTYAFQFGTNSVAIGNSGGNFSISGGRIGSNRVLMDGTELHGGSSMLYGTPAGLGVEAIREFTVVTNPLSADLGKRSGGLVNVATRSGTNELHGTIFEFHRNDNLDARNFFDPGNLPEFKRHNFGAAVGGPILKDRTFFFGNYEGIRQGLGLSSVSVVPDEKARQGLLPDPRTGGLRQVQVAASVRPYLAFYPLPNGRNNGDGTAEFVSNPTTTLQQDFVLGRIDHRFSEADSIFGSYRLSTASTFAPDALGTFTSDDFNRTQLFTLQESRVFSARMLNTLRFGVTRTYYFLHQGRPVTGLDPGLSFVDGLDRFGGMRIGGGSTAGQTALTPLGNGAADKDFALNNFQLAEQLVYTSGPHSLRIGGEVQRIHSNTRLPNSAFQRYGVFTFDSLESYLLGTPTNLNIVAGDPVKGIRLTYAGFYIQDDLKMRPSFTLNLGLRYEFTTLLSEVHGKLSNFLGTSVGGYRVFNTEPKTGRVLFDKNNSLKGFGPRIGFAWDVFGDGKTSIRSGFGMFYDQFTDYGFFGTANVPFLVGYSVDRPIFPKIDLSGRTSLTPAPDGFNPNFDVPTTFQYNLMIQREVLARTTLSIGYVGSHGYHLTEVGEGNAAIPQVQSDGRKFFPAGTPRRNPRLGSGRYIGTGAAFHYDSVQLSVERSYSQGLRFKASYTWSKNIDNGSSLSNSTASNNAQVTFDPDDISKDRGRGAYDLRQNFVFNYTYDLPWHAAGGLTNKLVAGWQLNGIVSTASGPAFSARLGFNRSRNGDSRSPDRPNLRAGAKNNPVLGGPDKYFDLSAFELQPAGVFGNLGRNTLTGPALVNFDFSLVKNLPVRAVSENLALQFRVELFNAFNHPNFGLPDSLVFNSNGTERTAGARIRSTVTTSRQVQLGLKVVF